MSHFRPSSLATNLEAAWRNLVQTLCPTRPCIHYARPLAKFWAPVPWMLGLLDASPLLRISSSSDAPHCAIIASIPSAACIVSTSALRFHFRAGMKKPNAWPADARRSFGFHIAYLVYTMTSFQSAVRVLSPKLAHGNRFRSGCVDAYSVYTTARLRASRPWQETFQRVVWNPCGGRSR